jgi:hypothetical protein
VRARALAPYGVLALGAAIVLLLYWPGRINADTNGILKGVHGEIPVVDHWTATLTWLWRQGHLLVGLDLGGVLFVQTVVLIVGVYLVLRSGLSRMAAAVVTVLILLAPPTFGFVGMVGRDMWFVAACVLAAGCAVAATRWTGRAPRAAAVGAGVLAAAIAITARQNGFLAVAPVLVALAAPALALARERGVGGGWSPRRSAVTAVALGLLATLAISAASTLSDRTTRDLAAHPEVMTYLYDLGYLTLATDRQLIPDLSREALPVQTQPEVRERWQPSTSLYMRADPDGEGERAGGRAVLSDEEADRVEQSWRTAVLDHPGDYLQGRFGLWRRQLGIGFTPGYVRAMPNDQDPALPGLSDVATDYAGIWGTGPEPSTLGGPLHHAWIYLLVCLLGLALALPRFPAAVRAAAALPAAGVGLQVSLFFLAPSVQWRYQLLAAYAAMIVVALAVAMLLARRRSSGAVS